MRKLVKSFTARVAIALAVLLAVIAVPVGPSSSHAAVAANHEQFADVDNHSHSHDVDEADETSPLTGAPDHHHKHNPGDQFHEKLGSPPRLDAPDFAIARERLTAHEEAALPSLGPTLHRPPNPSDIA